MSDEAVLHLDWHQTGAQEWTGYDEVPHRQSGRARARIKRANDGFYDVHVEDKPTGQWLLMDRGPDNLKTAKHFAELYYTHFMVQDLVNAILMEDQKVHFPDGTVPEHNLGVVGEET